MNRGWPRTTGKSYNKKSLIYKSGERGFSERQFNQSSSKDKELRKLTGFLKKKNVCEPVQKKQRTTEFSPEEIQNKV